MEWSFVIDSQMNVEGIFLGHKVKGNTNAANYI